MRNRRPRHDRVHDSRPTDPALPWQTPEAVADAELGGRLERALREGPGSGHVDVAQLLRGTRQATTKRVRVRRTAMIAAAAIAVGAVPVGLQTARWLSPPPVVPQSGGVSPGPVPTPPPTTAPPSGRPSPSPQAPQARPTSRFGVLLGDDPKAVLYQIPDSVAFDKADLPVPMSQILDLGQYRWIPVVQGQQCNEARLKRLEQPVAGRAWTWLNDSTSRAEGVTQVDLSVTGWASGKSAEGQFALLRRDAGACRFAERVATMATGDGMWLATGVQSDGTPQAYAATVVAGGLIVGVTVTSPVGSEVAVKSATSLVQAAVRDLERTGLTKELIQREASGRRLADSGAAAPQTSGPVAETAPGVDPTAPADE